MSSINLKYGTKNEIDATAKVEGQILFSTDQTPNDKIYFDKDTTTRIVIGGKDVIDTTLDAKSNNPIANSGVAGVMLTTLNEVNAVTQSGTIVDSLALKQLATVVSNLQTTVNNYWKTIYPVGSVYISVNSSFNPNNSFGGTWVRIQDRFLLASGSTYTNGNTGGEATHTLTVDEMPSHKHDVNIGVALNLNNDKGVVPGHVPSVQDNVHRDTDSVGGGQAHNNMPPYLVVMVWKRTA